MADFCKACSLEHFGKDFHDLAGLIARARVLEGYGANVICEGCGFILVDHEGNCISHDCSLAGQEGHGGDWATGELKWPDLGSHKEGRT